MQNAVELRVADRRKFIFSFQIRHGLGAVSFLQGGKPVQSLTIQHYFDEPPGQFSTTRFRPSFNRMAMVAPFAMRNATMQAAISTISIAPYS